jgi:polyhydroxyalkanoate synthesis repressor PhaR
MIFSGYPKARWKWRVLHLLACAPTVLPITKMARKRTLTVLLARLEPALATSPSPDATSAPKAPPITIKKYANRRLYNTATSTYVTLEHLAQMVRDGQDFIVFDAKSGDDITRSILTQIILEAESSGNNLLPVDFLRNIIRCYGDNVQGFLPSYLDLAMKSFSDSREQFSKTMTGNFDLAAAVHTNMSVMAEAAKAFTAVVVAPKIKPGPKPGAKNEAADDLTALRAQMAAMQAQLDKLGKKPD